jgi:excisionase family DNA binding protein
MFVSSFRLRGHPYPKFRATIRTWVPSNPECFQNLKGRLGKVGQVVRSFKESIEMKRPQYPGPQKVMSVREVAAYLSMHPSTIYRLLKQHQIPAFRVGSAWRFNIETIEHWIRQQEKPGSKT